MTKKEMMEIKRAAKEAMQENGYKVYLKDIVLLESGTAKNEFDESLIVVDYVMFEDMATGKQFQCYYGAKYYNPETRSLWLVEEYEEYNPDRKLSYEDIKETEPQETEKMTREEIIRRKGIIDEALRNNEIGLDVAGFILSMNCDDFIINKALARGYIGQNLANQLLNVKEEKTEVEEVEPQETVKETSELENRAKNLISNQTLEELLNQWELTSISNDKHIPMVRGWLLDEFEKRNPEAFEEWLFGDTKDSTLREYMTRQIKETKANKVVEAKAEIEEAEPQEMKSKEDLLKMLLITLRDLQSGCTDNIPELHSFLEHKLEVLVDILGDDIPEEYLEQIDDILREKKSA